MADINITTDFTEVNNLNTALKSTGSLFVKVVDSLTREEARAKRVTKKLADTTQQNLDLIEKAEAIVAAKVQQESDKREKARKREADQAKREAQKIVDANYKIIASEIKRRAEEEKRAASYAQGFQAQIGPNLGLGAQGISAGASASSFEAEADKLSQKYDRAYAASKLYTQQVKELNRAEMLGVITKQRLNKEIDQLDMELRQFSNAVEGAFIANNRFSQHINQTSNGVNKFGMYAQQVGYQVGDFFVQIQSGTNFLVAFGQQATQLAGLFPGVLGAALGIGISLATAVGAAFMRTASDVESSSDRQVVALKKLGEAIKEAQDNLDQMRFGGSAAAFAENEVSKLESQIAGINNLIQSLTANIEAAKNSSDFETALIARDLAEVEIQAQQETLVTLQEKLTTLKGLGEAQRMLNGGLSVAAGLQKAAVDATVIRLRLEKESSEKLLKATADQLSYMGRTKQESDNFVASLKSAYALLASSHVAASGIADQMARAANAWVASNSVGGAAYMANQYSLYGQGRVSGEKLAKESGALYGGVRVIPSPAGVGAGASSGGGGGGEPRDVIGEFQKQLDLERELVGTSEAYQKVRQALGDDFKTTNPVVIAGLIEQANQIERLTELENQRKEIMDTVKSSMEDAFMSMVDGTKSAKEAFKSMAAEIIKELYRVLVVQQLVGSFDRSTGVGSGIVGAIGKGFSGGRASGGSVMPGRSYLVGENGPELVIPRHSGSVVNANQTANAMGGSGSVTVQNNITVTGSDSAMVRTEIAKMIPQITNATKAAVIDARLRGGQMKQAFR